MELKRCSYPPRPPSAASAALCMGKAMGFIGPRGKSLGLKLKKQDGVAGLKLKNKMAPENKMAPCFRLEEVCILSVGVYYYKGSPSEMCILSGWSILLKRMDVRSGVV